MNRRSLRFKMLLVRFFFGMDCRSLRFKMPQHRSQIAPEASGRASPAEVAAEVAGAVIRPRDRVIFRSPIGPAMVRK